MLIQRGYSVVDKHVLIHKISYSFLIDKINNIATHFISHFLLIFFFIKSLLAWKNCYSSKIAPFWSCKKTVHFSHCIWIQNILIQINNKRVIWCTTANVFQPPSLLWNQVISYFLKSRISANLDKGLGFKLFVKSLYSLMSL